MKHKAMVLSSLLFSSALYAGSVWSQDTPRKSKRIRNRSCSRVSRGRESRERAIRNQVRNQRLIPRRVQWEKLKGAQFRSPEIHNRS